MDRKEEGGREEGKKWEKEEGRETLLWSKGLSSTTFPFFLSLWNLY